MSGWDLKISRMRRLQLSLDYLKFDEIERYDSAIFFPSPSPASLLPGIKTDILQRDSLLCILDHGS